MARPNRKFYTGTGRSSLVESDEFDGELVCRECTVPYSGPYSDQFDEYELQNAAGYCPTCGHPFWENR
jgi:hypothetical protein